MDLFNSVIDKSENNLNNLFNNEYFSGLLKILLISYACIISPKLPSSVLAIFDNIFVKILIIGTIVYISNHDFFKNY